MPRLLEPEAEIPLPGEPKGLVVVAERAFVGIGNALHHLDVGARACRPVVTLAADVTALAASGAGVLAGLANGDVVRVQEGTIVATWATGRGPVRAIAALDHVAAVAHRDASSVDLRDVASGARRGTVDAKRGQVFALALSPDGARLAMGINSAHVYVFDLGAPKKPSHVLRGRSRCIYAVAWLDDRRLADVPFGRTIYVWDVTGDRKLGSVTGNARDGTPSVGISINESSIAARGDLVAVAGGDCVVRVVSARTFEQLAIGRGHRAYVAGVAFVTDGELLSVARDGRALVWRLAEG
jgi:WD40 repeat protein